MGITNISFPGIGIDGFKLKNFIFSLGSFEINWSLIIFLAGVVAAFFYVAKRGEKREGISMLRCLLITAAGLLVGLICARAGYVLTTMDAVRYRFGEALAFWNGLSYPAGVFGFMIGVLIMGDVMKLRGLRLLDLFFGGVLLLQIIMAVATFVAAEPFGVMIKESSRYYLFNLLFEIPSGEGSFLGLIRMGIGKGGVVSYYHPVFLYELLWSAIGFLIVHFTYRRARFDGQCFMIYVIGFGFGHALLAGIVKPDGLWNVKQVLALVLAVIVLINFIIEQARCRRHTVVVNGSVVFKRDFFYYLNDEERAEKRVRDVAYITERLNEMAEEKYKEMTTEAAPENPEQAQEEETE